MITRDAAAPMEGDAGPHGSLPGFIATCNRDALTRALGEAQPVAREVCGPAELAHWGVPLHASDGVTLPLTRVMRTESGTVPPEAIVTAMREDPAKLSSLLPPFAAVRGDESGVTMVADSMGFRQLYHGDGGSEANSALSTSAILSGWSASAAIDHTAVAVQSLLGWQLGQRTLFQGISKLAPGAVARLDAGGVHVSAPEPAPLEAISLDEAVVAAAALLRKSLASLLDEHPDAVLQLTGGQDSRILLSAIPVARRRGLRAMTLGVPGGGDVEVAAALAQRYGLQHEVHGLAALDEVSPSEAWRRTRTAAMWLDGMSDPIALSALTIAESSFEQGVRISGLGGEIARGFYYVGRVKDRPVTRSDAEQLAAWRMFVNEAVEPEVLKPEFATWARRAASDEVHGALSAGGTEWYRATDSLYLRHRMQRWAGVTDTAVAYQRIVINPMLDPKFLDIAARLSPRDKSQSLFLARLQMELDPDLGRIPLEGRPAPIAYAQPSAWRSATLAASTGRRLAKKVVQRLRRGNRPPAGGTTLASRVVDHWRENPGVLERAPLKDFIRSEWLSDVVEGRIQPRPSSVALIANLVTATTRAP